MNSYTISNFLQLKVINNLSTKLSTCLPYLIYVFIYLFIYLFYYLFILFIIIILYYIIPLTSKSYLRIFSIFDILYVYPKYIYYISIWWYIYYILKMQISLRAIFRLQQNDIFIIYSKFNFKISQKQLPDDLLVSQYLSPQKLSTINPSYQQFIQVINNPIYNICQRAPIQYRR